MAAFRKALLQDLGKTGAGYEFVVEDKSVFCKLSLVQRFDLLNKGVGTMSL